MYVDSVQIQVVISVCMFCNMPSCNNMSSGNQRLTCIIF